MNATLFSCFVNMSAHCHTKSLKLALAVYDTDCTLSANLSSHYPPWILCSCRYWTSLLTTPEAEIHTRMTNWSMATVTPTATIIQETDNWSKQSFTAQTSFFQMTHATPMLYHTSHNCWDQAILQEDQHWQASYTATYQLWLGHQHFGLSPVPTINAPSSWEQLCILLQYPKYLTQPNHS